MAFNLREIFKALADAEVDYVVVGGLAVLMHGYLRATADLDLAIGLSPRNAGRGMQALASSGLRPRLPMPIEAFADAAKREVWLQHRHMPVFPLWDPANPLRSVDVFIDEPIPFDLLRHDAVHKHFDGVDVPVASIDQALMTAEIDRALGFTFADAERAQLYDGVRLSTSARSIFLKK